MEAPANLAARKFPCEQCGANLAYLPGSTTLTCSYCGHVNPIPDTGERVEELDFHSWREIARQESALSTQQTVKCNNCAAQFSASAAAVSDICPFCGSNLIVPVDDGVRIRPRSLLPFALDARQARESFAKWLGKLWLAPNDLKRYAREKGSLQGMYIPYWTYDCQTQTAYQGMRGIWRYRTETYTDSEGRTRTRQVRETDWYPCSGVVQNAFDDVLVAATNAVPEKHAQALQEWDLPSLVPYQEAYLSGFRTVRYSLGLEDGLEVAKGIMEPTIDMTIRRDIGGNEQRILSKNTQYFGITFKHILLPIWLGAYRFRDKPYSFLVNARTGEVRGDAPISAWKVAGLILLGLLIVGLFLYFNQGQTR